MATRSYSAYHEKGSVFQRSCPNWQYCNLGVNKFLILQEGFGTAASLSLYILHEL